MRSVTQALGRRKHERTIASVDCTARQTRRDGDGDGAGDGEGSGSGSGREVKERSALRDAGCTTGAVQWQCLDGWSMVRLYHMCR